MKIIKTEGDTIIIYKQYIYKDEHLYNTNKSYSKKYKLIKGYIHLVDKEEVLSKENLIEIYNTIKSKRHALEKILPTLIDELNTHQEFTKKIVIEEKINYVDGIKIKIWEPEFVDDLLNTRNVTILSKIPSDIVTPELFMKLLDLEVGLPYIINPAKEVYEFIKSKCISLLYNYAKFLPEFITEEDIIYIIKNTKGELNHIPFVTPNIEIALIKRNAHYVNRVKRSQYINSLPIVKHLFKHYEMIFENYEEFNEILTRYTNYIEYHNLQNLKIYIPLKKSYKIIWRN